MPELREAEVAGNVGLVLLGTKAAKRRRRLPAKKGN